MPVHAVLEDDQLRSESTWSSGGTTRRKSGRSVSSPAPGGSGRLTLRPAPSPRPDSSGKPVPGNRVRPSWWKSMSRTSSRLVETVHHPVPVVGVDVDVGDLPPRPGRSDDRDREVVEDAEPARPARVGVVEAARRMERRAVRLQRRLDRPRRARDDPGGRFEAPGEGRRIPFVEESRPVAASRPADEFDVVGFVERFEVVRLRNRHLVPMDHGRRRRGRVDHFLEEPDRQSTASLGERVLRPEIVLEETLIPDVPARRPRHVPLPVRGSAGPRPREGRPAGAENPTYRPSASGAGRRPTGELSREGWVAGGASGW